MAIDKVSGGDAVERRLSKGILVLALGANREAGSCSRAAAAVLGAEVRTYGEFRDRLEAASAHALDGAVATDEDFCIELALADGRRVELTGACDRAAMLLRAAVEDATERRRELDDLVTREEFCMSMAENSPAMLWMGDEAGRCVFLNRAQREFWGVDPTDLSAFDWSSTIHPDDVAGLAVPFGEAMAEQKPFQVQARYRRADGQYRMMRTEARPRFAGDGTFLGMTGVNTDITDQLVAEERTRMLMGELNHRTKNLMSVVQAIARQTAKSATAADFQKTFADRLQGLAASNDLLLMSEWTGVELQDLVAAQLGHLRDLIGSRILPAGPPLRIGASAAQTLGMALHELSTNSIKYGALSNPAGRVDLRWTTAAGNGAPGFGIEWIESGAGPATPPKQKGFGHAVISDMVMSALDAEVEMLFGPDGFRWLVRARSDAGLAG